MMQIQPVRRKALPQYPTLDFLNEHPELLYIVPERWRHNAFVLKILGGAACLLLASQTAWAENPNAASPSRIAPLFVHGDGRGGFGCIVVNPPVFLTEDEARQVVQEEAKKAGLEFVPNALTLPDAKVPVTVPGMCATPRQRKPSPIVEGEHQRGGLKVDGFDREHAVAYEFVSLDDFEAWKSKETQCLSSVIGYDVKTAAEALRAGLRSNAVQPRIGVFYEPFAHPPGACEVGRRMPKDGKEPSWEECRAAGRERGKAALREQVRDFIAWLKAQGVI